MAASVTGPAAAAALLAPAHAGFGHERLSVLHLDRSFALVHAIAVCGTDTVPLPIARIMREAVAVGTQAIVIAHNHPGGTSTPSRADRAATCRLAEALRPLSILLADHIVFGDDGWTSFQAQGWL